MSASNTQAANSTANWVEMRRQMPVAQKWAYLDHGAVAPISGPAQAAMIDWANQSATLGDTVWPGWAEQVGQTRASAAQLIGAQPEEIALVKNTTEGIGLVAEGVPWELGDNVVTLADEFPSNQYPWMNLSDRGVEVRRVPTELGRADLDRLADACDERTRIVTVSWVSYSSGWRNDLERLAEIAHDRGALLFIDAIQGLGVFPLDVARTPIDFLAADGHKWLLGPEGAGMLFIRQEHLDWLRPIGVGWGSVVHWQDFARIELILRDEAARYEGGSQNMPGMVAFGASLKFLLGFGTEAIAERVLEVSDMACARLAEIGASIYSDRRGERRSGIVVFEIPGRDPEILRKQCIDRGVVLSMRGGRLRISPHAYNNVADIDRLIEALSVES